MQRQQPNIRAEVSDGAIEETSREAQLSRSESQQSIESGFVKRQNRRSSLREKIGFGHALALGIAILGTTAGLLVGNYQYLQARKQAIHVDEETRRLSELHQTLTHTQVHVLQIIAINLPPAELQHQYEELAEHEQQLKALWAEMGAEANPDVLPELKGFLSIHQKTIDTYVQRFSALLAEIKSPADEAAARKLLVEFANEPLSIELLKAVEKMQEVEEIGDSLEDEARAAQVKAEVLRIQIIALSMLLSSAIAFILAMRISQAIARPLQNLTAIAHRVTEDANFDLRAPVTTADEVGVLAHSFNQLIRQVKHLLEEQKASGERQLLQNEKLASLGRMLAGVAHELNNPLGCIYGNLDYAHNYSQDLLKLVETYEAEIPHPPAAVSDRAANIELDYIKQDLPQLLQAMKIAAERAKQLVHSLKNFSRLDEATPHAVDLHACLDSTLMILHNRIKHGITVSRDYKEVPAVEGYAGMLSQVFINVISNAIEAFEETTSGSAKEIRIATERLDEDWVVVRIADSGAGIPLENQAKIFDTFFTTKPHGVGTGLGLAITYQIVVEKHGGRITCSSQVGKGTEFAIALPVKHSLPAAAPISVPVI